MAPLANQFTLAQARRAGGGQAREGGRRRVEVLGEGLPLWPRRLAGPPKMLAGRRQTLALSPQKVAALRHRLAGSRQNLAVFWSNCPLFSHHRAPTDTSASAAPTDVR